MKSLLFSILVMGLVSSLEAQEHKKELKVSQNVTFIVVATVMTEKTGGSRLACGQKNDANTRIFAALPSRTALYKTIEITSPETGKTVKGIPILDVGPHSTKNKYWEKKDGRPLAESGISDKYGKAKNKAGIDLSLKLCHALGLKYPYKGTVMWAFEKSTELAKN